MATGDSMISMSYAFRLGTSTVSKIISTVCDLLWKMFADLFVSEPKTPEDWRAVATKFHQRWNFPHCLGAIDGKHIAHQVIIILCVLYKIQIVYL